jgi:hypothetical protein
VYFRATFEPTRIDTAIGQRHYVLVHSILVSAKGFVIYDTESNSSVNKWLNALKCNNGVRMGLRQSPEEAHGHASLSTLNTRYLKPRRIKPHCGTSGILR